MLLASRGGGVMTRLVVAGSRCAAHLSSGAPLARALGLMLFDVPVSSDLKSFTGAISE